MEARNMIRMVTDMLGFQLAVAAESERRSRTKIESIESEILRREDPAWYYAIIAKENELYPDMSGLEIVEQVPLQALKAHSVIMAEDERRGAYPWREMGLAELKRKLDEAYDAYARGQ